MDEDLERLSREELIDEIKQLRQGIRKHRDSTGHEPVGISPRYGDSYRRRPIRFLWCRIGHSSSKAA